MFLKARDTFKIACFNLFQILNRMKTTVHQLAGEGFVDAGQGGESGDGVGHLIVEAHGLHFLGVDVDLPTGQLRCQPSILPALADSEGKLVFSHGDGDAFVSFVDLNVLQHRRLEGLGDKFLDLRAPVDDVHFFVVQLAHDVFHTLTAQAHAGAHGIHTVVARMHSQLGAPARFTRHGHNFHGAVCNFRNFQREKFHDKIRGRT